MVVLSEPLERKYGRASQSATDGSVYGVHVVLGADVSAETAMIGIGKQVEEVVL